VSDPPVELKRELGLTDLALTQILFIVGLPWVGVAAKLGSAHVVFWLAAIVFFYIPSAIVVIYLNRLMPLEGGLYQWAKLRFGDLANAAGLRVYLSSSSRTANPMRRAGGTGSGVIRASITSTI